VGIRVAIVDDHALVVGMVCQFLESSDEIEVIGTAGSAAEGARLAREVNPDVIVIDLNLPDGPGIPLIRDIRTECPETKVLVLTASTDPVTVGNAVDCGIHGYVSKLSEPQDLLLAVRVACSGGLYFDEPARQALERWSADPGRLADGEARMLQMIRGGQSHETVARALGMSKATLTRRLQGITRKLRAKNSADAANEAARRGLI
jgi:DNA-binding NarL/FixJ family response regulator